MEMSQCVLRDLAAKLSIRNKVVLGVCANGMLKMYLPVPMLILPRKSQATIRGSGGNMSQFARLGKYINVRIKCDIKGVRVRNMGAGLHESLFGA